MTKKVMKLINRSESIMECRVCGSVHMAKLRAGGYFVRGSWQCQHGCKVPPKKPAA
jgi:hypothetical protein